MTPEMIDEIENDLAERTGGWCFRVEMDPDECDPDRPAMQTLGVLIVDESGTLLAVEFRINDEGRAEVTARKFADGEQLDPFVFSVPGSVMVTT